MNHVGLLLRDRIPATLYQQATADHIYRFHGGFEENETPPGKSDVRIESGWSIQLDDSCGPLARLAAKDLARLLAVTFDVQLRRSKTPTAVLRISVVNNNSESPEAYRRIASSQGITIQAASDEGAMRALMHAGREMLLRRAPLITGGEINRSPAWSMRVTSPLFHRPLDDPQDYIDLPDAYLMNFARFGYNATYLYLNWFDYVSPQVDSIIARQGAAQRLRILQQACRRLAGFGVRTLFHVNTLAMSAEHPLFARRPNYRGAQTWIPGQHCLCSSDPEVLSFYRESSRALFERIPELAGVVLIVGGECFLHCYTRPHPKDRGGTNCVRCSRRPAADVVADAANAIISGVKRAKPDARAIVWPYSAFSWGKIQDQAKMVSKLDRRAELLISYEKEGQTTVGGVKSFVFDYSIAFTGPSSTYRALSQAARKRGLRLWARTETSQCIEVLTVPRIPIMHRWTNRFARLRKSRASAIHASWRFYGFAAQRTDELVDHFCWSDQPNAESILMALARRDFGLAAAPFVVRAWKMLSEAFGHFPYGAGVTGFPYFRGPMWLGSAHPFVFDRAEPHGLSSRFYAVDPLVEETMSDPADIAAARRATYFTDLLWTQPFGPDVVATCLRALNQGWTKAVRHLQRAKRHAKETGDARRFADELRIAEYVGCIFRTADNLLRFQRLSAKVREESVRSVAGLRRHCLAAVNVLRDEIANASRASELCREDDSLGYVATYGRAFNAGMIDEKIAHARAQISVAIPRYYFTHAFHCFGVADELNPTDAGVA